MHECIAMMLITIEAALPAAHIGPGTLNNRGSAALPSN
jgi:hypothetical protein